MSNVHNVHRALAAGKKQDKCKTSTNNKPKIPFSNANKSENNCEKLLLALLFQKEKHGHCIKNSPKMTLKKRQRENR